MEYRSEVFEQDGQYVAICPELNVSSFDDTPESAEASLQEALTAFLEGCEALGTLDEVLEESGFTRPTAHGACASATALRKSSYCLEQSST